MTSFLIGLWLMLCGHALMDFPLQSDFIAKGKCPKASPQFVPWYYVMASHALVHGLAVTAAISLALGRLAPGAVLAGIFESALHFAIDVLKCENCTNIHVDQALHVLCKLVWAFAIVIYVDVHHDFGIPALALGAAVLSAIVLALFVWKRECCPDKCPK